MNTSIILVFAFVAVFVAGLLFGQASQMPKDDEGKYVSRRDASR